MVSTGPMYLILNSGIWPRPDASTPFPQVSGFGCFALTDHDSIILSIGSKCIRRSRTHQNEYSPGHFFVVPVQNGSYFALDFDGSVCFIAGGGLLPPEG